MFEKLNGEILEISKIIKEINEKKIKTTENSSLEISIDKEKESKNRQNNSCREKENNLYQEIYSEKTNKTHTISNKKIEIDETKNLQINQNISIKIKLQEKNINENIQIDNDWEEVKKGGNKMKITNSESSFDISIIGNIFEGILKHDLQTKGKSTSKCLIEPFFILSLDLADFSLDNCFNSFFSKKKVENITNPDNSFFQKAYIEKLPKILIIHVKGFYYDKNSKKVVKVNKEIDYGFFLNIKKDYFSPSIYNNYKDNEYELVSSIFKIKFLVVIHKGNKASEGHYICFCKDSDKIWWALDDSKIFQVEEKSIKTFRPYILFYRKNK